MSRLSRTLCGCATYTSEGRVAEVPADAEVVRNVILNLYAVGAIISTMISRAGTSLLARSGNTA